MPYAFVEFEALYLRAYWLERSSFLKTSTARLQLTMFQNNGVWIFLAEKYYRKQTENDKTNLKQTSNLTSISTMFIQLVPLLKESVQNQMFSMLHYWKIFLYFFDWVFEF